MGIKNLSGYILVCIILSVAIFSASPVHACTPTVPPPPGSTPAPPVTLEDRVNLADVVLLGTVIGGESHYGSEVITGAEVQVERYLKGYGASTVIVNGFGYSAQCLALVQEGSRYIFLAREQADGSFYGVYYQGYSPLVSPSDENIESIVAFTNQSIAPEPDSAEDTVQDDTTTAIIISAILIAGSLMVFVVFYFMFRRVPRKSKAKRE